MDKLRQDLRFAFRAFVRQPGFSALVVGTLALGIGLNTAIFSIVNSVILRPLPFPDSDRIVQIKKDLPRFGLNPFVFLRELRNWQKQNRSFDQIEGYQFEMANLSGGGEAERVNFARVTGGLLRMLAVQPVKGRGFLPEDDMPGAQPVALLSEGLWKRRFGSDSELAGKTVTLDNRVYAVVGIIPSSFHFPSRFGPSPEDLWTTFAASGSESKYGMPVMLEVVGRLKPGVPMRAAGDDLDAISKSAPMSRRPERCVPVSWQEEVIGDLKFLLLIFMGAVGLVLLIACVNIANLLLSRAADREKEIAVRASLGAGRGRIFRQLLTESLLLSVLGALAGLLLAFWAKNLLYAAITARSSSLQGIATDFRVLGYVSALALLTGLLFGLVPALRTSRVDLVESLKEGGRVSRGSIRHRLGNSLVIAEIAIALILLVGAGLLLRSMLLLRRVDPGFGLEKILCMTIDLTPAKYPKPRDQSLYFQQVVERIRALPAIQSVAASACVPLGGFGMMMSGMEIEGRQSKEEDEKPRGISFNIVSSDYFRTMNIPLISGRQFSDSDGETAPGVVIISRSLAKEYFPKENPIGLRIKTAFERNAIQKDPWQTIVGVVGDVHQDGLDREPQPQVYRFYLQAGTPFMALIARVSADPRKITEAFRNQAVSVDRDQPPFGVATLGDMLETGLKPRTNNLVLLGAFALFALALASVGIYGVVSYNVSGRTHEIGIRMALGGTPASVVGLIVGGAMLRALIGMVIGLFAAAALSRFLSSLLFGVTALDPVTFVAVSALELFIAFLASSLPSLRASRVHPVAALRCE